MNDAAVYLESGKDAGWVVVEPEQDGADHVADGEVGEEAMMDGTRTTHEAQRRQREAVEQQRDRRHCRVRREPRAEVDRQSAVAATAVRTAHVASRCRCDTDIDEQFAVAFHVSAVVRRRHVCSVRTSFFSVYRDSKQSKVRQPEDARFQLRAYAKHVIAVNLSAVWLVRFVYIKLLHLSSFFHQLVDPLLSFFPN